MKEFSAQTGGRYTYVDDFINLQDLALSFASIFDECDNFIISGCEVSDSVISPGYVYINKKIRYFNGATNVTFPCYIYEQNSTETLTYANGQDKVGRKIYGCALGTSVPSGDDPLTNAARQYILLGIEHRVLRLREALFGQCFMLSASQQTVQGNVTFEGDVTIDGNLNLDSITLVSDNAVGRLYHYTNNGNLIIQNKISAHDTYQMIFGSAGFEFRTESAIMFTVTDRNVTARIPFSATQVRAGNVTIANNDIYEHATNADDGSLRINMLGYNRVNTRYRDTLIGNGKGTAIITVDGSTANVQIDGTIVSNNSVKEAFVLKSTYPRTSDENFLKTLVIKDANDYVAAIFGYNSTTDGTQLSAVHNESGKVLSIINNIGGINITGSGYVNIGPVIMENGVAISSKYVQRSELPSWVFGNAPSSGMTQEIADGRYARLTNGLAQFIRGTNTASVLCSQIGAMTQTQADARYAKLSSYLADMARTDSEKALIRQNIGAAASNQLQSTIYDSGWKDLRGGLLFARQWGKVVSIQGTVFTTPAGNISFVIPAGIAPPAYDVELLAPEATRSNETLFFRVKIAAGERNARITHCPETMVNSPVTVTLTYMVA